MRFKCFLLLAGLGLIFGPAARLAPLPVPSAQAAERAAPAKPAPDLEGRWKQLAGGAAVWKRADITDPLHRFVFDLVADRVQSTNGEITREQFLALAHPPAERRADGAARPAPAADERPKQVEQPRQAERPKADERRPATTIAALLGGPHDSASAAEADAEFRRRDVNRDGLLDYDEMDEVLRAERDRWDENGDGFIDLAEFRAYYKARQRQERAAGGGGGTIAVVGGKTAKASKAAAADDLPAGLPDWFRQYDTDGDGQIGLYEWKAAGQPIAKFLAMDNNGDGFLTPDEVLAALPPKEAPQVAKETQEPPRNDNNQEATVLSAAGALRHMMLEQQVIQLNAKTGGMTIRIAK
jgi:Ca2+-binding EF-hand superfamily protein